MKIKSLIIIFLITVSCSNVFAQKEFIGKINQFNDKGQKDGFWIEKTTSMTIESYYKNGKKSGIFRSYSPNGKLQDFGEFKNGEEAGTWYSFGDQGHLIMIQKDFSINTDTVILDTGKKYLYPHKCYTIMYNPNGTVEKEGVLLWNDDPQMDDVYEFGKWKYYDEAGKLTGTKYFK